MAFRWRDRLSEPGDIESIEVLKDAASAAIYGKNCQRVVLITTKSGKEGKCNSATMAMWVSRTLAETYHAQRYGVCPDTK